MSERPNQGFLGENPETGELLKQLLNRIVDAHLEVRANHFTDDPRDRRWSPLEQKSLTHHLEKILAELPREVPFYHPRYMAQMVADPSLAGILGYFTFLLSNPNNHSYEASPVTTEFELAVVKKFLDLLNWEEGWGHLTSGGTAANLEALWIARESHPRGGVVASSAAHFAWKRLANVIDRPYFEVPVDAQFRIDLNQLEDQLKREKVFFVVSNLGSTGTGSVDDTLAILELRKRYCFHLHIDGAYGGFFKALLCSDSGEALTTSPELSPYVAAQLRAAELGDSFTMDPHKHGLVSYGAGAVFYRNPDLKSKILHGAPYTYNLNTKPNIGTYTLEGSRPGAAAAGCYLAYQQYPLHEKGIGTFLKGCLRSALALKERLNKSQKFELVTVPDLDIVCFYRCNQVSTLEEFNQTNLDLLEKFSVSNVNASYFLSKFAISEGVAKLKFPNLPNPKFISAMVMRCVFMKSASGEAEPFYLDGLVHALESAADRD